MIEAILLVHSFYATECCGGKDCRPVPCEQITTELDGWAWRQNKRIVASFAHDRLRISPDGECHVCISSDVIPSGICIYLPPGT